MYCFSNAIESEVLQRWFLIQQPSPFETKIVPNGHCISNSVLQDYSLFMHGVVLIISWPQQAVRPVRFLPGPVLPVVAFMPAHAQVVNNERWPGSWSNQVNNQQLQRQDCLTRTSVNHCRRCDLEAHRPDHFKGASYGPEYSALLMTMKVHKSKDGCSYKHLIHVVIGNQNCTQWRLHF